MRERTATEKSHDDHGGPVELLGRERSTPGVEKLRAMLAAGDVTAAQAAGVVAAFLAEHDALLRELQHAKGNAFVAEVERVLYAHVPPSETELLLQWAPAGAGGAQGQAAWLLRASALGWVDASGATRRQLDAYVTGQKSIESTEGIPNEANDRGIKPKRTSGTGNDKRGVYDVKLGAAPILETLVHMVRAHAERRLADRHPHPTAIFELGTMLRSDHGFGGSQHTIGSAIDLGEMDFDSVDGVLAALDLLPPGKVSMVFPDNRDHLHLSVAGDQFELGMPFQGDFFPAGMNIIAKQRAAEASAAAGTTELHVQGLYFGSTRMNASTGTYDAATQKWRWSKPAVASGGASAVSFLQSKALKAKLKELSD